MKNDLVVKKNVLINAKYSLSPLELKIVLAVVSRINKNDTKFKEYILSVPELNSDYKDIQKASKSLMQKVFEIKTENGWLMMSWFSSVEYKRREGKIACCFDPKLKPFLLQLKDNFTSYTLKSVLPMRSSYSIRIYELMKQYEKIGSREIPLIDLFEILNVPKSYHVWRDFEKRVLVPADKEINEHSDLSIEYTPLKTGRKITSVKFLVEKKDFELTDYIKQIRSQFIGKTLAVTTDKETGKTVELSVDKKGRLYNKKDPNWKISSKRSFEIWKTLFEKEVLPMDHT